MRVSVMTLPCPLICLLLHCLRGLVSMTTIFLGPGRNANSHMQHEPVSAILVKKKIIVRMERKRNICVRYIHAKLTNMQRHFWGNSLKDIRILCIFVNKHLPDCLRKVKVSFRQAFWNMLESSFLIQASRNIHVMVPKFSNLFKTKIYIIIYLIIKIVIIDWSKLNHVTQHKSTYHCLEGLGVLSFDLRSNDSTPKPCDRSSNPSATFAHTYHCCVTMVAIHCDVTMTLNIGITILPDLNWFWNYFINKGKCY